MQELTDATFPDAPNNAIVMFTSPSCSACKALEPLLNSITERPTFKVNVEEAQKTAYALLIRSLPTTIIFQKGKEQERIVGLVSQSSLEEKLQRHFTPRDYYHKRR